MKTTPLLCIMIISAAFAAPAEAIFKCTTPKGVVYQDRPCRDGNESDVQIVVPTGQVAPRQSAGPEAAIGSGDPQGGGQTAASKSSRTPADDPASVTKPVERKGSSANVTADEGSRKTDAQASTGNAASPTIPDPARNADPSAKYYTTDGFGSGTDTPSRLTCESSTGEKRVFYLTNGKLTSI